MIVIILGSALIIFTILYFTPGNPAQILLPDSPTAEEIHAMEVKLGLDKPFLAQFGSFLYKTFIKFDLGTSWTYNVPVMQELFRRLPRTVLMGIAVIVFGALIGIPLGILAATHQGKWQDYGVLGVCMIFISLPHFWIAMMAVIVVSLKLGLLPAYGIGGVQYYILPIFAGVLQGIAENSRQMRSSMLEVIRADFVATARAKGQSENVVIRKHMLPNALMPVITVLGNHFAYIVAGVTITEKIFGIPGVGLYLLDGIMYRDYPIVRGCTLFFAVFCAMVMLLVDLVYAMLDPRIRSKYSSQNARRRGSKVC
jgi:ABC-type dipeptide/oligopeptide/nickel transport system permease component